MQVKKLSIFLTCIFSLNHYHFIKFLLRLRDCILLIIFFSLSKTPIYFPLRYWIQLKSKYANNPSSRFPTKGILSGMSSKTPAVGFNKYNKQIAPNNDTNNFFIFFIKPLFSLNNNQIHFTNSQKIKPTLFHPKPNIKIKILISIKNPHQNRFLNSFQILI